MSLEKTWNIDAGVDTYIRPQWVLQQTWTEGILDVEAINADDELLADLEALWWPVIPWVFRWLGIWKGQRKLPSNFSNWLLASHELIENPKWFWHVLRVGFDGSEQFNKIVAIYTDTINEFLKANNITWVEFDIATWVGTPVGWIINKWEFVVKITTKFTTWSGNRISSIDSVLKTLMWTADNTWPASPWSKLINDLKENQDLISQWKDIYVWGTDVAEYEWWPLSQSVAVAWTFNVEYQNTSSTSPQESNENLNLEWVVQIEHAIIDWKKVDKVEYPNNSKLDIFTFPSVREFKWVEYSIKSYDDILVYMKQVWRKILAIMPGTYTESDWLPTSDIISWWTYISWTKKYSWRLLISSDWRPVLTKDPSINLSQWLFELWMAIDMKFDSKVDSDVEQLWSSTNWRRYLIQTVDWKLLTIEFKEAVSHKMWPTYVKEYIEQQYAPSQVQTISQLDNTLDWWAYSDDYFVTAWWVVSDWNMNSDGLISNCIVLYK